jgi:hypothetical protein
VSNTTPGTLGLGYAGNEATNKTYPTVIDKMVGQGLIESRAYSLYLDDIDASTGSLLFGGVDLEKFSGPLVTFPLNDNFNQTIAFYLTLTEINVTPPCGCATTMGPISSYPLNVILDSGTTDMSLPTDIANDIAATMGATLDDEGNYNLPNCDLRLASGSVGFSFSGFKIEVPYLQFIQEDQGSCTLGIQTNKASCGNLGMVFLGAAYVVFDLVVPASCNC